MKVTLPICIAGVELEHEYEMSRDQVQMLLEFTKKKVDDSDRPFQVDRRALIEKLEAVLAQAESGVE